MITHFIFMSSSYSLGKRIALDFIISEEDIKEILRKYLDRIIAECGKDVSVSTHMIQSEDTSWSSVCNADHFFKDVYVVNDIDKFIQLIKKDRQLEGIDIAKYILSKVQCTQLKLQKLVYLCFADYLCDTGKKLFTDAIYAYKYGPVVDSVYQKYKKYGYKPIEEEKGNIYTNVSEMPAKSRILFAEDGTEKIISIDNSLEKYGNLTASQLVELTHRANTPWKVTPKNTFLFFSQIKPEIIKKFHKFEIV